MSPVSRGALVVVKLGGNAMVDDQLLDSFASDVVRLRWLGVRLVVVHGGGPQITAELDLRGVATEWRGGLRVTTPEVMRVVREVLVDDVNAGIASRINAKAPLAVGLSGDEAGLLTAERRTALVDGRPVDVGLVGDVTAVDTRALLALLDIGSVPVVATVAADGAGVLHNVNADTAAGAIAAALRADVLVVLTDVPGLRRDPSDPATLISRVSVADVEAMLPRLAGGMAPKMEACVRAMRAGVGSTRIVDGRVSHAVLTALVSDLPDGTLVTA